MARINGKDRGLFERPPASGVWWIRYYDAEGKEHREKIGLKGLARQVYAKRKTEIRERRFFPKSLQRRNIRLSELIENYMVEAKTCHKSLSTSLAHSRLWTAAFGTLAIQDLTPADLEKWKRERLTTHAKATVVRELSWLRRVYNVAIRDEKVEKNPVNGIRFPRVDNGRLRFFSEDEEKALRPVMKPEDYEIFELDLHTGLRRSELFNLTWDNIDFRNSILCIPVSKNGERRYVPINHRAVAILRSRQQDNDCPWVFPNPRWDGPMNGHNWVQRVFKPAMRKAGIVGATFHSVRHTTASKLVMAGVDIRTVGEILGHKNSLAMTMRYAHLAPAHLQSAVNKLLPTAAPKQVETPDELTVKPAKATRKPKSKKESPQ